LLYIIHVTQLQIVFNVSDGEAYGWGRNETGQLGLGYSSPCVPVPTLLSIGTDATFVSAGVGKYHTLLVTEDGTVHASGGNKCGQLGVNNEKLDGCDKFRKCAVVDYASEEEDGVKIIHAACGENISALISSKGHLYTAGSSEWGQLGNGETGEYIVSAGRLGFANCAKFLRRDMFVESESTSLDGGRVKCTPMADASSIRLQTVSCGRNHLFAVEASSSGGEVPRVFSWGCGDYGTLGHAVQADEYIPRVINAFKGPVFANNHPVDCAAGANCSLVRTKNGHVYYMGKHKNNSEAVMRPSLIDVLANNAHVVTCIGAGSQTVFCSTSNGVTVSSGHGSHGELGYGKGEKKSSSKYEFVNGLDSCIVTGLACGMGHTLFLVQDNDADDAKAIQKIPTLEESDAAELIDQMNVKRGGGEDDGPPKKKAKGRPKKG
jgi:alpha-tubulin suppressor-like RCC1 family protein